MAYRATPTTEQVSTMVRYVADAYTRTTTFLAAECAAEALATGFTPDPDECALLGFLPQEIALRIRLYLFAQASIIIGINCGFAAAYDDADAPSLMRVPIVSRPLPASPAFRHVRRA